MRQDSRKMAEVKFMHRRFGSFMVFQSEGRTRYTFISFLEFKSKYIDKNSMF